MKYNNCYINGVYLHNKNIEYPDCDSNHMMKSDHAHDYIYDKVFAYRLKDKKNKFIIFWIRVVLLIIVFPVCRIRYNLKIKGKKHYKEYKKLTRNKAMITISNHTIPWDILCILSSRNKFVEFPMWQEGAESSSGMLYRRVGGIPIPKNSVRGMVYSYNAMKDVVNEGKWLHIYPEASSWPFYPALRDFQIGAFSLAYDLDKPILPLAVEFREPHGLYKLFKKDANVTLHIGAPKFINRNLPKKEATKDLCDRCHLDILKMLNISSEEENKKIREIIKNKEFN